MNEYLFCHARVDDLGFTYFMSCISHRGYHTNQHYTHKHLQMKYETQCVVSPLIIITKCTDGKHRNYDLTIIILWNNHYLKFNVGLSDDSKK